jgi:leader peptidase (prepilin peptidase)/N-methyltransferase
LLIGEVLVFGLLVGSFLNVCIHRLPLRLSVIRPGSRCPACKAPIRFYDNIPVVSYLLLRGRCRGCGGSISWRYPVVELTNGLGYVFILHRFGLSWTAVVHAALFSALLVVTFIDLDHQIIPDRITLPGIGLGVLASATVLPHGWVQGVIGLFVGGGLFYLIADLSERILKQEGMGGGDIKLMAMLGAFLGWRQVLLITFVGALAGSVVGLILMTAMGRSRREPVPFGPFLSLGAVVSLFWGEAIWRWYIGLSQ